MRLGMNRYVGKVRGAAACGLPFVSVPRGCLTIRAWKG